MRVIEKLNENQASAFGIKLDRYLYQLPEDLLKKSKELNFPIIYVPDNYSYAEIINPILYRVANDNYNIVRQMEEIRKHLTDMLLVGTSVMGIIEYLSSILECNICFENNISHRLYYYPEKIAREKYIFSKKTYLKGELTGTLYLDKEITEDQEVEVMSIQLSLMMINLLIQRKLFEEEISESYKSELSIDLCNNNLISRKEIYYRGNINNWAIEDGIQVLIYDIDDYKKMSLQEKDSNEFLKKEKEIFYKTLLNNNSFYKENRGYFKKSDSIVLMYSVDMADKKIRKEFMDLVYANKENLKKSTHFDVTVGIGNYYPDILDTYKSYRTAMDSVQFGRIFKGNDKIHCFNDIELYKNLYESYINGIDYPSNNIVEKIRKYDQSYKGELEKTLLSLIKNDWNIAAASRDLYVHYNTINYRYSKLLEILGKEALSSDDKFLLQLYFKFDDITRTNQLNER